MKGLHTVAFVLLVIGGLNWLLVGLSFWDIGTLLGGPEMPISRVLYILVGLSAIFEVVTHRNICKTCSK